MPPSCSHWRRCWAAPCGPGLRGRRARVRRAALWSQETVRAALAAGPLGPTALSIAAFLGVVALAGPRWGEERIVAETRGLSVVLAVDISRSMLRSDATPNRLRRAL